VFGRAAGLRAAEALSANARLPEPRAAWTEAHLARFDKFRYASGSQPTAQLRAEMQNAMQSDVAVFRTEETMKEGVEKIDAVFKKTSDIRVTDRGMIWNTDLVETLEFDNLIGQAAVTVKSAVNREESRGAHAREDFSARDDVTWMKHTLAWFDDQTGKVKLDYRPVHTYTLSNDIAYIQPKARVY